MACLHNKCHACSSDLTRCTVSLKLCGCRQNRRTTHTGCDSYTEDFLTSHPHPHPSMMPVVDEGTTTTPAEQQPGCPLAGQHWPNPAPMHGSEEQLPPGAVSNDPHVSVHDRDSASLRPITPRQGQAVAEGLLENGALNNELEQATRSPASLQDTPFRSMAQQVGFPPRLGSSTGGSTQDGTTSSRCTPIKTSSVPGVLDLKASVHVASCELARLGGSPRKMSLGGSKPGVGWGGDVRLHICFCMPSLSFPVAGFLNAGKDPSK